MSLPKYILNIDEFARLLNEGVQLNAEFTDSGFSDLLKKYFENLPAFLSLPVGIDSGYMQCSVGLHSYIPALAFDYELVHVFNEDVYITGLTYSQTGWKVMDCWSLYIGGELLFDGVFTKELGEYKHFNSFFSVQAGTEIKVVHHNNSGNSKQVWFDIDYLKMNPNPYIPPAPEQPVEPEPPVEPDPGDNETIDPGKPIKIIVKPTEIKEVGYVLIPDGFTGELIFTMNFETISGEDFPDLEVAAPNGDAFGYTRTYMNQQFACTSSSTSSCASATYTGWASNPEQMVFANPMPGRWYFYAQSVDGNLDSVVTFTCSQAVNVTYKRD